MDIILLNTSDLPIYQQIKDQIIEQIMKGQLLEGEQLPSIRSLAKELKISVITTKRAYEELEKEGYIDTVVGKGSYVSLKNTEVLKQKQLEMVANKLQPIVNDCKTFDITMEQLIGLIETFFKED